MPKKQHPIFRLHKIKVHHNRWFAWTIAYVLMVAIAMVGYLKVSDINFDTDLIAQNNYAPWRDYSNDSLGFSLRYPSDWALESDSASSLQFTPTNSPDEGVTVQVTKPEAETDIRQSLKKLDESRTMVDTNRAVRLINDLGGGHTETVIMSLYQHKLYVIRGNESLVQKILLTFKFE